MKLVMTHNDGGAKLDRYLADGWRVVRKHRATINGKQGMVVWLYWSAK